MRQRPRIILRVRRDLGEGDVVGGVDEFAELAVRHWRAVDPERINADAVDWRFLNIVPVRTHTEFPAGHEDHVGERIRLRRFGPFGNVAL